MKCYSNYLGLGLIFALSFFAYPYMLDIFSLQENNKNSEYIPRYDVSVQSIDGAQKLYEKLQSNVHTGRVELTDVLKARQDIKTGYITSRALETQLNWRVLGPQRQGGRVRAIKKHPNKDILYLGSVSGGLFRSEDNGGSWNRVESFRENLAISDIEVLADGTVFIATGCVFETPNSTASTGFIGGGLFYSEDDGETWMVVEATRPAAFSNLSSWTNINVIMASEDESKLFIAGNGGSSMYVMDVNTKQLSNISSVPNIGSGFELAASVSKNKVLLHTSTRRLYLSEDAGNSFTDVTFSELSRFSRVEIAYAPSNDNIVYLVASNSNFTMDGVYKSLDGGKTWNVFIPGGSIAYDPLTTPGRSSGQGFYDLAITVSPTDENTFFVGGVRLFGYVDGTWQWMVGLSGDGSLHADIHNFYWIDGVLHVLTDGGLYKGDGRVFAPYNLGNVSTQFYKIASSNSLVIGGTQDNGIIRVGTHIPEGREVLTVGADGFGVFVSTLFGQNFRVATAQFGHLERTNQGNTGYSEFYSDRILDLGEPLSNLGGFYTVVDVYETRNDSLSTDSVLYIASDTVRQGDVVSYNSSSVYSYEVKYTIPTTTGKGDIALLKGDSLMIQDVSEAFAIVPFAGVRGVWMTRDIFNFNGAVEWWKISTSISSIAEPYSAKISAKGDIVYIASGSSIYRISGLDKARSIETADIELHPSTALVQTTLIGSFEGQVSDVYIDPRNDSRIVITLANYGNNSHVYICENADVAPESNNRSNFTDINGNLPDIPVYSICIDLCVNCTSVENRFLIGTEYGLYVADTIDGNRTNWKKQMQFENVPVFDIVQNNHSWEDGERHQGRIYVGTHGRGIWGSSDTVLLSYDKYKNTSLQENISGILVYPNPVNNHINIDLKNKNIDKVKIDIYTSEGKLILQREKEVFNSKYVTFDVSRLGVGATYFLRLYMYDNEQLKSVESTSFLK